MAEASGFDEALGEVVLDDALLGVGFDSLETLPASVSLTALSAFGIPLADFARSELFVSDPEGAIHGDGFLEVGG